MVKKEDSMKTYKIIASVVVATGILNWLDLLMKIDTVFQEAVANSSLTNALLLAIFIVLLSNKNK
jgi:uncharacterized membrane protein YidH (DUF202 family)